MSTVYSVSAEWDIGQEGEIFATEELAKAWVYGACTALDLFDEVGIRTVDEMIKKGLITIMPGNLNS